MSDEEISALIAEVETKIGHSWAEAVSAIRDDNTLADVEQRIREGDIAGAVQGIEKAAEGFAAEVAAGYATAGDAAAAWLSKHVDTTVKFDVENKRAVAWAKGNAAELVEGFKDEQKALAKKVITEGIKAGTNPRVIARDLRDFTGLTEYQAGIVDNYRKALETGDYANALGRELSSGHSDRTIRAAQRDGRAMTAEEMDTAVSRYQDNWIAHRAGVIAHHEALGAVHQGAREGFQQAIDAGHVEAEQLEREWRHASSRHPRASHQSMQGQKRGWDEPFITGDGVEIMFAGDPDAPIEETAGCHCAVSTRLVA